MLSAPSTNPSAMMSILRINKGRRRKAASEKKNRSTARGMSVAEQAVPMRRNLIAGSSAAAYSGGGRGRSEVNTAAGAGKEAEAEAEDMSRRRGLVRQLLLLLLGRRRRPWSASSTLYLTARRIHDRDQRVSWGQATAHPRNLLSSHLAQHRVWGAGA